MIFDDDVKFIPVWCMGKEKHAIVFDRDGKRMVELIFEHLEDGSVVTIDASECICEAECLEECRCGGWERKGDIH